MSATRRAGLLFTLFVFVFFAAQSARAQVSMTALGTPIPTQTFDSLATAGTANTWTDNTTLTGWYAQFASTANPTTYRADSGGSNTGAIYSWGVAGVNALTERAFGSVGSGGTGNVFWAIRLVNNTGATITSLDVSFVGEQWRQGGCAAGCPTTGGAPVAQTVDFQYQVANAGVITDANAPTTGWLDHNPLDFTSPQPGTATAAAIEGNLAANRTALSATITVTVAAGQEIWLRWSDINHADNDHGLAIDSVVVTPQGAGNSPISPNCPTPITTVAGTATSGGVSATDSDGTVISATITGITPSNPGTITLTGFTPAGGVGGTANATVSVGAATPVGSYNVTIQWANNDGVPQTANCVVAVNVTALSKIHDVQGNGAATPIPGATVTVEGVVVGAYQGTSKLQGFFLEEEDADYDADPNTSEGIFVFCSSCPTAVTEGQRVQVTGTVSEFNNMTEITASTAGSVVVTNAGNNLAQVTPSPIDLPIVGVVDDFYEAREGMKVTFIDTLTVSEYFELPRYGQTILYEGGRPRQFTEANPPSVAGNTAQADNLSRRKVILDDENNAQEWYLTTSTPPGPADGLQYVFYPRANGGFSVGTQGTDFFRGGDLVNGLTGVLHWSFPGFGADTWRIRPTAANPTTFTVANPRPATPPTVGGAIKVVGMNLLNYFTTIDTTASNSSGPCGPSGTLDCRGADSVAELNRQRERASIVICDLNADVYGFAELENTTPSTSITDLLGAVNTRCGGAHPYDFVNTGGTLGTDAIRVQQIYRTGIVSPVGSPLSDLDPVHNRPPTAQTFDVVDATNPAFGQRFTVIINHFKSKGCPGTGGDADAGDGQGCFNATRVAQANRLLTWINGTVLPAAGDPDVILLGDFNSYAKEDPVTTLQAGGYNDLETTFHGANAYSYLFDGQLGHLDYGFASASLLPQVTGADAWHINADEADLFDYNDEVKDTGEATFEEKPDGSALVPPRVVFQPSSPYRASDHDPVLVGLFQVADVSLTKTLDTAGPYYVGQSVTFTITVANAGPDPATNINVTDTPSNLTITNVSGACASFSPCTIASLASGANTTITVTATIDSVGAFDNSATATAAEGDPNSANNTDNDGGTAAASADVSITKTLDTAGPYYAGTSVTYTITVANAGPSTATNITVTDTPSNLTITNVSGACTSFSPCTIASLASGANTVITVTATIDAAGAFDNSASANGTEFDPNGGNNTDNAGDTASASADVSVTKTLDTAPPYTIGQTVTFTITVANAGPSTATNINVTDTPSNLTITNVSGACTSFSPCTIASLASGANTTITVTATIDSSGAFSNAATATAAEFDPNTNDNSSSDGDVASQVNVVEVTKAVSGTFVQGTSVTYTVVLTNNMTVNQPDNFGHEFTDILPSGLTLIPASFTATSGTTGSVSNIFFWDGAIPSGGTVTLTFDATISPTATGTICNQGQSIFDKDGDNQNESSELTDDPSTGANNDSTCFVVIQSGVVDVTKAVSGTFVQGSNVTYTIVLTNNMTVTQPDNFGHEFTDILPSGLTLIPASFTATSGTTGSVSNIFFWDGAIPSGGTVTLTFQATIDPTATGTICNQGQSIFDRDGDNQNESSELTDDPSTGATNDPTCFTVLQANVVDVTKAVSGTFVQGTNVTYTIVMTNMMTVTQPDNFGHEFTDILPAGLTLIPASFTATSGTTGSVANIFFWDGAIPSGGTVTLTFQATISPTASGQICNQGQSIFDKDGDGQNESSELTDDPSTAAANDPTCFYVVQANVVEVTKAVSGTFTQGTNVTYTIVLTNNMTVTQPDNFGHEFTDNLPAGLTLIPASFTATSGTTGSVSNIFFWDGSIPSGGTVTLTFQATISPTASGQICNQGQSIFDRNGDGQNEASELTDDPSTAANNDPTCFYVVQSNIVEVTKAVSGSFVQGTNVTYTIVLTNNMTVTQPNNFGHEFTDNLPAGLTLIPASFTASSGTTGSVSNIFFWDGSIPSGGTVTLTFQATISPTATGQICNQGQSIFDRNGDGQNEASELTDDPSTGANNDPTCFTVVQANKVEVTKAVSGTFTQGSNVTYTIVLTNNMSVTQPNNAGHEFTDVLPSGLTYVSSTATSGTAALVTPPSTFAWDGSIPSGGSVTITITCTINPTTTGTVSNQGQSSFDTNGDGSNDGSEPSDDPSTAAVNDSTNFVVLVASSDTDGDGVDDVIEQAAPNGGDGNGDGIPDYTQGTVASIPAATGSGYLTLQSSCQLQQVAVTTESAMPSDDPGHQYPHGLISFRAPCSTATFSLFIYGSGAVSSYRKYGPNPPGGPQQWYGIPSTFSVVTVGSLHPRRADFTLTDGQPGDDTPVDGVIVDQGGPTDPDNIPTASEWGLLALAMALAALAALKLRA